MNFEVGLWRKRKKSFLFQFKKWELSIDKCCEGCLILTVGPFYLTWLKGRCR